MSARGKLLNLRSLVREQAVTAWDNNNKVYSKHVQYNSSQIEYENKIPKSDMSLKLKIANTIGVPGL